MMNSIRSVLLMCTVAIAIGFACQTTQAADPFVLVVMDPLSKPLSCDCVRGYAQRDYNLLAAHLESSLGREVKVVWFESLAEALDETRGRADLVIGKHSVVLADERTTGHELRPLAQLTGKDGDVTQTGLVVVRRDDAAQQLSDLDGYRLLFGPKEAAEKSSAPERALQAAGVTIPSTPERFGACSEAATALMETPTETKTAAIISSYAEPLLEGCGSIKKGDLRVIGESKPVPFITAFISDEMEITAQERVLASLMTVGTQPKCLIGLETLAGFIPWSNPNTNVGHAKKKSVVGR